MLFQRFLSSLLFSGVVGADIPDVVGCCCFGIGATETQGLRALLAGCFGVEAYMGSRTSREGPSSWEEDVEASSTRCRFLGAASFFSGDSHGRTKPCEGPPGAITHKYFLRMQ